MIGPVRKNERREYILQVSSQLFARQGYHGTSTRDIARVADLAEITLFRYFQHKEEIFWSAVHFRLSKLKMRREILEGIAHGEPPEIVLPLIMEQLVDTVTVSPELTRLIGVAFLELPNRARHLCHEYLAPSLSMVRDYLRASVQKGQIRNVDSDMLVSALAAMVILHSEIGEVLDGFSSANSARKQSMRSWADFWLSVLVPDRPSVSLKETLA